MQDTGSGREKKPVFFQPAGREFSFSGISFPDDFLKKAGFIRPEWSPGKGQYFREDAFAGLSAQRKERIMPCKKTAQKDIITK